MQAAKASQGGGSGSLREVGWYNPTVRMVSLAALSAVLAATLAVPVRGARRVDYNDDVRPILSDRCYTCHGPDEAQRQAGLRLDRQESAFGSSSSGVPIITAGDPDGSALLRRVRSTDLGRRMPPAYLGHDPLSEQEVATLARWVEEGADWEGHWSFAVPVRPTIPELAPDAAAHSAIDALVKRRLSAEGLAQSPRADRRTLARRAAIDLTGLPPEPDAVDDFVSDSSRDAYEAFLDRLLDSPRFGEHWAAMWLDAARYADTNGYQTDGTRSMWRWRDWVIDAFNRNLPFDRFTIEQIAGDMLPDATLDQVIASGFNRNHRTTAEGGSVNEEFRVEYVADRAETTATVWLGMTLGCARCHDHKFDPLSQREYYQFFSYFNNVQERGMVWNFGNEDPLVLAPTPQQQVRLQAMESDLNAARRAWDAMAEQVRAGQARWEAGLGPEAGVGWAPSRGLLVHAPLDGLLEVPTYTGGSINGSKKPERVSTELTQGRMGSAAKFDGTRYADLGEVGNFNYMDPLTVSAWIRPDGTSDGAIVAAMGENPIGNGWGLFVRGGKLWWHMSQRWSDLSVRIASERPIEPGKWQHVALTYDGRRKAKGLRMYINGNEERFEVLFDNNDWPSRSNQTLKVGGGGGLDNRFRGLIDEVRIYGRVLSREECISLSSPDGLGQLATIPAARRSPAQVAKLREAFLAEGATGTTRRALLELREADRRHREFVESIPTVMVMKEGPHRQAYVLERGRYDSHGEPVDPGIPAAIRRSGLPQISSRLELAQWIASRDNPLTARVAVNRFWQALFGVGLVKTVDDFGSQGEAPSNQELLDWLAVEFTENGWDVKGLLKTIMLSETYQQDSRVSSELLEKDPENRLLARGPRFRLTAAAIRDQALSVTGLLQEKIGGPSVKPYQPPGLWEEVSGEAYTAGDGPELYRRSLYTYWKRTVAPPSMMNFDASDREVCTVHVKRTNTPLQALNLMNDTTFVEAARHLATAVARTHPNDPAKGISEVYRRVLGRPARPYEVRTVERLYRSYKEAYSQDRDAAEALLSTGDSRQDWTAEPAALAAYTGVASVVLNLDETVTKQ